MDPRDMVLGLVSLVSMLMGAIVKTLWDAVQKLTNDLRTIEKDMASTYVRRDDFSEYRAEIVDSLNRIEEKIDDLRPR